MREILFRAKRITDNQCVYGGIAIAPDETVIILTKEEQIVWNVIPETVGQFTGLYDKTRFEDATTQQREYAVNIASKKGTDPKDEWKGVKIFEGDILGCNEPNSGEYYVTSFEINPIYGIFLNNDSLRFELSLYEYTMPYNIKVIGNIHDNPELLK